MRLKFLMAGSALSLVLLAQSMQPAEAGRRRFLGQNGAATSYLQEGQYGRRAGVRAGLFGQGGVSAQGGQYAGPNGGTVNRGGLNAFKRGQGGLHASGSQGTTPAGGAWRRGGATGYSPENGAFHKSGIEATGANGGTFNRGSDMQYQQGVGGYTQKGFNAQTANGASATGYKTNNYDAGTGTGTATRGRDFNTASGDSYGYDKSTSYTKGQGFTTTVDTQNKQDYTVEWQKGSKPVYTPVPTQ